MADFINVAVDAMGGDNAPVEIVKGVVDAVHANDHVKVYLTGQEELVRRELEKYTYPADRIEVGYGNPPQEGFFHCQGAEFSEGRYV